MIKDYSKDMRTKAIEIFTDVYQNPPFSFKWINEKNTEKYFFDFENTPGFKGFVIEYDDEAVGFCFGRISDYFQVSKYYINEIFIRRDFQGRGVGTEFIENIRNYLRKNNVSVIEISTDKRTDAYKFYSKLKFVAAENNVTMIMAVSEK